MCEDLKEQFKDELIKKATIDWEDILSRFLLYKTYAEELKIDCDVSEKAMDSYEKYPYVSKAQGKRQPNKKYCEMYEIPLDDPHIFRGDTMTSGWWFVQQIVAFYTEEDYPGDKVNTNNLNFLLKNVNMSNLKESLIDKDKADTLIKCFTRFLNRIHSVGNMILVPSYFNMERSGDHAIWDCWDITLHAICSWYKDNRKREDIDLGIVDCNRDLWLIKLFSKGGKEAKVHSVTECKFWLTKYFMGVENFICRNYLQDYFDFEQKCVKSLMNGEPITESNADKFFRECPQKYKPQKNNVDQMIRYFQNFVDRTDRREKRINGELK